jgi:hypothetical protein
MSTYETVTLIFTGMVTLSTAVYAWLTRKLVAETILLRKAQTQPHIGVYLRPSDVWVNIFDLIIENDGQGPAYNIRWNASDLPAAGEKGVHLDYLKNLDGLTYMAPGQRVQSFFGSGVELLQHNPRPSVTLNVEYADAQNVRYKSTYVLEPARFEGQSRVGGNPEHEMAKALSEVATLLKRVIEGSRLRVLAMSEEGFREEQKRELAAIEERRRAAQQGVADDRSPSAPARR